MTDPSVNDGDIEIFDLKEQHKGESGTEVLSPTKRKQSSNNMKGFFSKMLTPKKIVFIIIMIVVILLASAGITFLVVFEKGKASLHEVNNSAIDKKTLEEAKSVYFNGKEYVYNEDLINILVIGTDLELNVRQRSEVKGNAGGMADTLFLLTIDNSERKVHTIAINRYSVTKIEEYYEDFEGKPFSFIVEDQICRQYGYGKGLEDSCERQAKAISNMLYNIPVNGYVSLSLDAIRPLNNVVGGVELEVLENVPAYREIYGAVSRLHNAKGKKIILTDDEACAYVRWRVQDQPGGSDKRLLRQRQYVKALLSKMISLTKKDFTFPLRVKDSLSDYLVTDIDLPEMVYMGMTVLNYHIDWDNVGSIPGESYTMDSYYDEDKGVTVYHEGFKVNREELQAMIIERFYKAKE